MKKKLIEELLVWTDHLVHNPFQYKAFKAAREEAEQSQNVATIQVDWSKNQKITVW